MILPHVVWVLSTESTQPVILLCVSLFNVNTYTIFRPIVARALIEVYFSQKCLFEKNVFGQNNEREIQCMVLKKSNTQKKNLQK